MHYAREGRGFYLPGQSYFRDQRGIGAVSPFSDLQAANHV